MKDQKIKNRAVAFAVAAFSTACAGAQSSEVTTIYPGDERISVPEFTGYEAEYTSAFGRFINQVRPVGDDWISVINLIDMPNGVIVDHRGIDRQSLRMEFFHSPYFAWGQEYVVGQMDESGYDWTRVPMEGGQGQRTSGEWNTNGVFDDLGFSPTLASMMPLEVGAQFAIPRHFPRVGGNIDVQLIEMTVVEREILVLDSGVECNCWVIEEVDNAGARHRYWIDRQAPFLFRRHRDIGGQRDFVSEVMSFRTY